MLCPVCPIDVNALSSILVCYKLCVEGLDCQLQLLVYVWH